MMNFPKLAFLAIHYVTKLAYVCGKTLFKWFNFKFEENDHIPDNVHCYVTKDSRKKYHLGRHEGVIQSKNPFRVSI